MKRELETFLIYEILHVSDLLSRSTEIEFNRIAAGGRTCDFLGLTNSRKTLKASAARKSQIEFTASSCLPSANKIYVLSSRREHHRHISTSDVRVEVEVAPPVEMESIHF